MANSWNRVDNIKPREGVPVQTIGPNGTESTLKLRDNLWFFSDDSMYVYYTPVFWKYLENNND